MLLFTDMSLEQLVSLAVNISECRTAVARVLASRGVPLTDSPVPAPPEEPVFPSDKMTTLYHVPIAKIDTTDLAYAQKLCDVLNEHPQSIVDTGESYRTHLRYIRNYQDRDRTRTLAAPEKRLHATERESDEFDRVMMKHKEALEEYKKQLESAHSYQSDRNRVSNVVWYVCSAAQEACDDLKRLLKDLDSYVAITGEMSSAYKCFCKAHKEYDLYSGVVHVANNPTKRHWLAWHVAREAKQDVPENEPDICAALRHQAEVKFDIEDLRAWARGEEPKDEAS